ncbi:MAG: TetR/AcrR family transcriptional regulator [Campylobacterales bacterium]
MDSTTTEKILIGAAQLFAEVGFDAARVDAIADRCGVNKASLYYHFKDKKTLYNAVIVHYLSATKAQIETRVHQGGNPFEQLRDYIRVMFVCFHAGRFISPIMLREAASGGRNLSGETLELMRGFLGRFRALLESGVATGDFKAEGLPFVHMTVIGTIHFLIGGTPLRERFIHESLIEADRLPSLDPEENAQRLYEMVAAYLKPKETR